MPQRYRKLKIDGRTVSEHRFLMERHLGRELRPDEVVHHINEDRFDNRIENLQVMTHQEHAEHHNQKHPRTRRCVVCDAVFEPHPTKRSSKRTCSASCHSKLRSRYMQERMAARRSQDGGEP